LEKLNLLEEKIKAAARLIASLREANAKLSDQYKKLAAENEMLLAENQQTRRIMSELDKLRDERKIIKQKCERLIAKYVKMRI